MRPSKSENSSREGSCPDNVTVHAATRDSEAISHKKGTGGKQIESAAVTNSNEVIAKLKMDTAIRDVESSSFEPKTFKSSRSQQKSSEISGNKDSEQFQFGTMAEKAANTDLGISNKPITEVFASIAGEGLCHPNLFGDPIKREERWLEYLSNLRKTVHDENHHMSDEIS